MPQFDFTTYGSQIFWFALCFAILYFFLANVIIPRVRAIVEDRKTTIDGDVDFAKSLEASIDDLKVRASNSLKEAAIRHKMALDIAVKDSVIAREKALHDLKDKSDKMAEKSKQEIANMIKNSQEKNKEAVNDLIASIEKKIY